jgi:hypothetical protein
MFEITLECIFCVWAWWWSTIRKIRRKQFIVGKIADGLVNTLVSVVRNNLTCEILLSHFNAHNAHFFNY